MNGPATGALAKLVSNPAEGRRSRRKLKSRRVGDLASSFDSVYDPAKNPEGLNMRYVVGRETAKWRLDANGPNLELCERSGSFFD